MKLIQLTTNWYDLWEQSVFLGATRQISHHALVKKSRLHVKVKITRQESLLILQFEV